MNDNALLIPIPPKDIIYEPKGIALHSILGENTRYTVDAGPGSHCTVSGQDGQCVDSLEGVVCYALIKDDIEFILDIHSRQAVAVGEGTSADGCALGRCKK